MPVGRPVPGRQVVLDGDELVAIGDPDRVPGAYRRRPELTAERFGTSPDGRRTCRTGDRARLDDDGNVHIGGRLDDVVKIAGARVDLAEVEAALAGLEHVSGAAAVTRTDRHGDLRLHVFVTVDRSDVDRRELRAALEARLPRAMLPDTITPIEELPRLPAGKVDRHALADRRPDARPVGSPVGSTPAPVPTGIEPRLAAIWAAVVDRPQEEIGPDDDFFDLGGDSLRATRMFTEVDRALGVGLPVATLLTAPTLRSLDGAVRAAVAGRPVWSPVVEIRPPTDRTTRPALIVLHDGLGQIMGARRLAGQLPPDQPIWAVAPDELSGRPTPARSLEELAAAYLRELHAVVPDRPWVLFGPSFGGTIAFEIARQAGRADEPDGRRFGGGGVALVVLGDTVAPGRASPWTGRRPGSSAAIVARRRRETRDLPLVERAVHALRGTLRLVGGAVRRWLRNARGQWDGLRLRAVIARGRPVPLDLRERLITDRCIAMAERYSGGDLPGEVLYVASTNGDPGSPVVWAGWSGTFRRIDVSVAHHDMLRDPGLAVTAEIIDRELARLVGDALGPPAELVITSRTAGSGLPVGAAAAPGVVIGAGGDADVRPGPAADLDADADGGGQVDPGAAGVVGRHRRDLGRDGHRVAGQHRAAHLQVEPTEAAGRTGPVGEVALEPGLLVRRVEEDVGHPVALAGEPRVVVHRPPVAGSHGPEHDGGGGDLVHQIGRPVADPDLPSW